MIKVFIGIVCICLIVLAGIRIFRPTSNSFAGESADLHKLKELLQNTEKDHTEEITSLIIKSRQQDITPWLQQHVAEYSPLYIYALATRMSMQKAPIQDTLFWTMLASLRLAADAALCKDSSRKEIAGVMQMEYTARPMLAYGEAKNFPDDEQLKQIGEKVVAWDKEHPQTNSPYWLCGHDTYPQNEWEQRRQEAKKEYTASLYK